MDGKLFTYLYFYDLKRSGVGCQVFCGYRKAKRGVIVFVFKKNFVAKFFFFAISLLRQRNKWTPNATMNTHHLARTNCRFHLESCTKEKLATNRKNALHLRKMCAIFQYIAFLS